VTGDDADQAAGMRPDVLEAFTRLPDAEARESLVREFLPLAEHLARRFAGRGESAEDLRQVASLGLLHAIDRFDPQREVQFSTFATVTIVGELKRHFRDKGWSVRVPRNLQESALQVNRALSELWQQLGRSPSVQEIAQRTHLSVDEVLGSMDAVQAYAASSLDAPVGEGGVTQAEMLRDSDQALEVAESWLSVAPALERLPERERRILFLRFFKGLTQSEIADDVGISQMHVSRLLSQTLERLRSETVDGEEPDPRGSGSSTSAEDADAAGTDQEPDDDEHDAVENRAADERHDP
jgi:RNA polymerase sigma-B factor